MAESESGGEKTEAPSGRRLAQAREQGNVGKSQDLVQVLNITATFIALEHLGPKLWQDIVDVTRASFSTSFFHAPVTTADMGNAFILLLMKLGPDVGLLMLTGAIAGGLCGAVQTNFLWSWGLLKPRMRMINPLAGFQRIFSKGNATQLLKSFAKLGLLLPIGYFAFLDLFPQLLQLTEVPLTQLLPLGGGMIDYIFWKMIPVLAVIAIIDLVYQKWTTTQQLKMTKTEVKDERKSQEGDEETKRKIMQMGMQRIRQRMLQNVPKADVVITNPTHIAIALKYNPKPGAVPTVLAKGKGHLAKRIREIAAEHKIPIVERKPLARALYELVEVGKEIPFELYQAVAEVLAYVYRLKGKNPFTNAGSRRSE